MVAGLTRAVASALLLAFLATGSAAEAQAPGDPRATCFAAERLTRTGHPQAAVDRIREDTLKLMQSGQAVDGILCPVKLSDARKRIRRAQLTALKARDYMDGKPSGSRESTNPKDDPKKARVYLKLALAIDAENALAKRLVDEPVAAPLVTSTDAETAAKTWQTTWRRYLDPATTVAVPLLLLLIALFVLARLATRIRWLVPRSRVSSSRPLLGWSAALLGLGTAVQIVSWSDPVWELDLPQVLVVAIGVLLTIGLGATWLASRLRILITCHDAAGGDDAASTGRLVALVTELGGDDPRGVELPRGTDVTALSGTPLQSTPEGRVAQLVAQLAVIALGAAPWKVLVEKVDDEALAVTVARNGVTRRSVLLSRSLLGLTPPPDSSAAAKESADAPVSADLYRVAAAIVVTELARCHRGFESLGEEPDWQSVGLQFVATTDLARDPGLQRCTLAAAVAYDDDNQTAYLSYLYCLERRASKADELRAYADTLTAFLDALDAKRHPQLKRRALHTRLACEINLYYAAPGAAQRASNAPELSLAAEELRDFYGLRGRAADDSRLTRLSRPAAAALLLWVHDRTGVGLLTPQAHGKVEDWLGRAASPLANYQAGCYFATGVQGDVPMPRRMLALTHLRRAVTDPRLAETITTDPQLKVILGTEPYRAYFRDNPADDLFTLAPFAPLNTRLQGLGIATAADLLMYTPEELSAQLSASPAICAWLITLATAATYPLGEADDVYRVELCREALSRQFLPPVDLPAEVLETLGEELRGAIDGRCKGAPDIDSVQLWLLQT